MSRPTLALIPAAYKAGKLYSVLPEDGSGDFDVSRNGTGTYIGEDGLIKTSLANEPRFEYNFDGSFKGVLVEPAATNICTNSNEFLSNNWLKGAMGTLTANIAISPQGLLNAVKIRPNNLNGNHFLYFPINFNKNTNNTVSCFFKAEEYTSVMLNFNENNIDKGIIFNLTLGTISNTIGTGVTGKITNFGNGWYKGETTILNPVNLFNAQIRIIENENNLYVGDPTKGLLIFGTQIELGTVATSYIPTLDSQVTRPTDLMTVVVPINATQVIYILDGNVITESVVGGSTFTLPNGHITQLTMN